MFTISISEISSDDVMLTMSDAGFGKMAMLFSTSLMPVTIAVAVSDASEVPPFAQLVMM